MLLSNVAYRNHTFDMAARRRVQARQQTQQPGFTDAIAPDKPAEGAFQR